MFTKTIGTRSGAAKIDGIIQTDIMRSKIAIILPSSEASNGLPLILL